MDRSFRDDVRDVLGSKLGLACLIVLILRIGAVAWLGSDSIKAFEDYSIAQNLSQGYGFSIGDQHHATALKAPVYPLFLAGIISIAPNHPKLVAALIQHCLSSLSALLLCLALLPILRRTSAFAAGWVLLLHPSYLLYASSLEATNLFVFLSIVWMLVVLRMYTASSMKKDLTTSMVFVLAFMTLLVSLTQPIAALPFMTIASLVLRPLKLRVVFLVVIVLGLLPWSIRNERVFSEPIIFKSPVWMNLYVGFDVRSHGCAELNTLSTVDRHYVDSARTVLNDVQMEVVYRDIVRRTIADHPWQYLQKSGLQLIRYWTFPPSYDDHFWQLSFLLGRLFPTLVLFMALIEFIRRRELLEEAGMVSLAFIVILLYFTLIYSFTHSSNIRFKLDCEWIQCIMAGIVIGRYLSNRSATSKIISQH